MPGSGSGISWGNSSTDRGLLNPIEKEDKMFNETEKEECTFHPELGSNDVLRDTVPSSGYGTSVVTPKKIRTVADPELVFEPQLPGPNTPAGQLRAVAPSSGYGSEPAKKPTHKKPPLPRDAFSPQITKTKMAVQLRQQAPSSGYGRRVAKKKEPAQPPPFKPIQIKFSGSKGGDKLRKTAPSSKYGLRTPNTPKWKLDAMEKDRAARATIMKRQSTHTLLDPDNSVVEEEELLPEDDRPPFVLDGQLLESQMNTGVMGLSLKYQQRWIPERVLPASPMKAQYDQSAISCGYGTTYAPPTDSSNLPEAADERETGFKIGRATPIETLFSTEIKPVEDEAHQRGQSPTQKPIMAHVPSSGYGLTCPATVPRPHREDGPKWLPAGPKEGIAEPAAPPPPARINDIVGSHGYGTVSPAKGKRKPVEFGPVWVPNSKNTTGALPDPPPAPPRKEIPVGSHYRKGEYLP